MTGIISKTPEELALTRSILKRDVPTYRQAYSDRTAWLMACVSELAYLRFNPLFKNADVKSYFSKNVDRLIKEGKKDSITKLINTFGYDPKAEEELMKLELESLNLKLEETFDENGTQAILVSTESFLVLGFRGTESTSPKDIKADLKAKSVKCVSGGQSHTGFTEAFDDVASLIQAHIDKEDYKDKPLFITGHSLGGALATIAAKRLRHSAGMSACYTYGSPRVGDTEWVSTIKTPIYRVVNAADCVTMLPPGGEVISVVSTLAKFIPGLGRSISEGLALKFGGYLHGGNMRYLTSCPKGCFDAVKLLYSVNLMFRVKGLLNNNLPWSKPLSDHSISTYRKKLGVVANSRTSMLGS